MDANKKIAQIVKERIEAGERGTIYFVNSFADLQNDEDGAKNFDDLIKRMEELTARLREMKIDGHIIES